MSKQPDDILNIYFRGGVHVGGQIIDHWSGRVGETNQLFNSIKVEDRGPQGVLLRYDSGSMHHEITIPLHKVDQITRNVAVRK